MAKAELKQLSGSSECSKNYINSSCIANLGKIFYIILLPHFVLMILNPILLNEITLLKKMNTFFNQMYPELPPWESN